MPEVETFLRELNKKGKPIGTDQETAKKLETLGGTHINKNVDEVVIDQRNKIITTPAYMLGKSPKEIEVGITKLVKAIIKLLIETKVSV